MLLSDGGGDDRARALADALRATGVRVITIGLGADVDAARLTAMATLPADYHFAPPRPRWRTSTPGSPRSW